MCIRHFANFSITTLLLSSSVLLAENSGFYGSVGFQYSNMTRAQAYTPPKNNPLLSAQQAGLGALLQAQAGGVTPQPLNKTLPGQNSSQNITIPNP